MPTPPSPATPADPPAEDLSMYEAFYGLDRPPFTGPTGDESVYQASAQQDALGRLRYAVERRLPFAVLVGEAGVGKSVLADRLAGQLRQAGHRWAHLTYPLLEPASLLAYLAREWAGDASDAPAPPERQVRALRDLFAGEATDGPATVLLIDDAHLIERHTAEPDRVWETLRLLTGLAGPRRPSLTCLLVGRTVLLPGLQGVAALADQLDVACVLRPFDEAETAAYVSHRLTAAGASRSLFDAAALAAIHRWTGGVARRIDRLADLALLVGYSEEWHRIGGPQIDAVAADLAGRPFGEAAPTPLG